MIQVELLGPVQALVDDTPQPVVGLRRTAVLGALALHHQRLVSIDRLIDVVWGDAPPPAPTSTLRSHISHLRRLLGVSEAISARSASYLLDLGEHGTDVQVAERLIGQANECADPCRKDRSPSPLRCRQRRAVAGSG